MFAGERRKVEAAISLKEDVKKALPNQYALAVKINIAGTLFEKVYYIQQDK